jgi:ubiquinone/menaquinone biosynthesis C-methylase UbiE
MNESSFADKRMGEHNWHSREYVDQWITRDTTRDDERRPLLRQMLALAPFSRDAAITVLDIGAGYGVLSEEVLNAFPYARVTLQDYSEPMVEHARKRLDRYRANTTYIMADLTDPAWGAKVGGPYDLAVSGLAIHNLRLEAQIKACYRSVCGVLKPGGLFLDCDLVGLIADGANTHTLWLQEAGFENIRCTYEQAPLAILAAWARSR